jgi:hypothetical protein
MRMNTQQAPLAAIRKKQKLTQVTLIAVYKDVTGGAMATRLEPTRGPDLVGGWHKLPEELKVQVLRERLLMANSMSPLSHRSHTTRALLPLSLTSKAMRALALEVYYSENRFKLTSSGQKSWAEPGVLIRKYLRDVEVHIRTDITKGIFRIEDSRNYYKEWCYLLIDDTKNKLAACAGWQKKVPSLKHLKVVIEIQKIRHQERAFEWHTCYESHIDETIRGIEKTRIDIQTEELEVEVRNLLCKPKSACNGTCKEKLIKAITNLVVLRPRSNTPGKK